MGIKLSRKHGVNPSIDHCFVCGTDIGIVLFGRIKDDKEAPRNCCTGNLCKDCEEKLKTHVAVIEMKSKTNPERTGRVAFVSRKNIIIENINIAYMTQEEFTKCFENEIA